MSVSVHAASVISAETSVLIWPDNMSHGEDHDHDNLDNLDTISRNNEELDDNIFTKNVTRFNRASVISRIRYQFIFIVASSKMFIVLSRMSRMSELQLSGTGEAVLILVSVLGIFLIGLMFGFLICFYTFR